MPIIKQLSTRIVYQNKWMTVREDTILRPSGAEGIYGVVEKPDFVVILPIQDDSIYLVEQYRYPVKARHLELPMGSWEDNTDADHEEVARGELKEETGLISHNLQYVGFQYLAYGYSSQGYHIYLAKDLEMGKRDLDAEEEDLITKKFSLAEFESMICSGTIQDATTLNAYSLAKLKGFL